MKYNTIYELNERGRATICPQCKNEDIADDANYCEICGASLINRCTNTECNTIGSGKARFCKECGSETEFGKRGYLKPWNTEGEIEIIDEIVEDEIEINMDELEDNEENMVEIEIAHDDEFDNEEDEAPEIDHSILGELYTAKMTTKKMTKTRKLMIDSKSSVIKVETNFSRYSKIYI